MPGHFLFYLALSFFCVHEMDAVRCREWRIFPLLSFAGDQWGRLIFITAHIPLFLMLSIQLSKDPNNSFITVMDIFFIVHMLMHLLYLRHKKNEFKDGLSWVMITGNGFFGLMDLLIAL